MPFLYREKRRRKKEKENNMIYNNNNNNNIYLLQLGCHPVAVVYIKG
jgi:hypothetical protein